MKIQIPSSKLQGSAKHQAPKQGRALRGFFGDCNLGGFWCLVFGGWSLLRRAGCVLLVVSPLLIRAAPASDASFIAGTQAFKEADFERSAAAFRQSAALQPASGTLQNLGLAEWQRGKVGAAILAWEQALWLDPFNQSARVNLRFA